MFDQVIQALVMGLIQGLAEWFPISSTAHLRIVEHFWNLTGTGLFNIALHAGTLAVVMFYFRKEVKNILSAFVHLDFKSYYGQLIRSIVIATVPTAAIGLFYVEFFENTMQTMLALGIALIIGATIVYISRIGNGSEDMITCTTALIVGAAQGFAIIPGLSRSGITISIALLLGLKREKAFEFSFLLSIPAILGGLLVEAYANKGQLGAWGLDYSGLLAGVVVAMVAGYLAIRLVSRVVASKKFHYFALYTSLLGVALIMLVFSGH